MAGQGQRVKQDEWVTPDGLLQIRGWARDGYTDKQIAANIGIGETTFCAWKKRYPEIVETLKRGRRPVVEELEDALYKGAMGYDVEEKIEEITSMPDGTQQKHIRRTTRHIPINASLLIFALKNLKPTKFRDKPLDADGQSIEPVKVVIDV